MRPVKLRNVGGERPLIVILGPTGSGKSELALNIAEKYRGEVVNYDSVQLYIGFDVGSAKLPPAQRRGVPHHLLDIAGPGHDFTAGEYSQRARQVLDEISSRAALPVLCGGTGFYLRALLCGLSPASGRDERTRRRLQAIAQRRPSSLHFLLSRIDELSASQIHPNDHQKLIRAIEMARLEGRKPSAIQSRPREPLNGYRPLKIGLNPERHLLHRRLNARSEALFSNGLIEETSGLLAKGYSPDSKPMQSLGYRQALALLAQKLSLRQAVEECGTKTRQYAKRQMTWFRKEPDVNWLHGFGTEMHVQESAQMLVEDFIAYRL